ncbi:hypothetical protein [Lepagella muris]|nr:hypothetical protein [Lepagella muris]
MTIHQEGHHAARDLLSTSALSKSLWLQLVDAAPRRLLGILS